MKRNLFLSWIITLSLFSISTYSFALSMNVIGEAEALKGKVLYSKGSILAVDAVGAYSPFQKEKLSTKASGKDLIPEFSKCKEQSISSELVTSQDESAAIIKTGDFGGIKNATIAVVKLKADSEIPNDLFGYRPMEIRVFDGKKLITKTKVSFDAYPCDIVLDQFTAKSKAGNVQNELAFAWVSVGNGYTSGVTVYNLK